MMHFLRNFKAQTLTEVFLKKLCSQNLKDNLVSLWHAGTPKQTTSLQRLWDVYALTLFIPVARREYNSFLNNFN